MKKLLLLLIGIAVLFFPVKVLAAQTYFSVGQAGVDVIPHQIVRTNTDRVYIFGVAGDVSSVLKGYWTTSGIYPTQASDFSGSISRTEAANIISVDTVYDGANLIHLLINTQDGVVKDVPFDTLTNTFKTATVIGTGSPTIVGGYVGTSGVSGMVDKNGVLQMVYWSSGNHIFHKSYTVTTSTGALTVATSAVQVDGAESSNNNHPVVAVSPLDNSLVVAWVSGTNGAGNIYVRKQSSAGVWGTATKVNTSDAWTSPNSGINIDQGPSVVIDQSGIVHLAYIENWRVTAPYDYGRVHYVTNGGGSWSDLYIGSYSHDPALAIDGLGGLYIIGHGYPLNTSCTSADQICYSKKNVSGTWSNPQVITSVGSFDTSPSVKWSVVGFNRPETVEFAFSAVPNGYASPVLYYGRLASVSTATPGDLNSDGRVDIADLRFGLTNIGSTRNIFDLSLVIANFGNTQTVTPTPTLVPTPMPTSTPTPTPALTPTPAPVGFQDWPQIAKDAQNTGFTSEDPGANTGWSFAWHFKPTDMINMSRAAHAVTGGGKVYMPGGTQGIYAINQNNGTVAWQKTGTFNAAAAYGPDNNLYVGSADGKFYKINPADGATVGSYNAGSPLNHAVILNNGFGYVTADDGKLHKVNLSSMTAAWVYTSGSMATTPVAYSASRDLVIFGTKDLYVHGVKNSDGTLSWKVKPTSLPAGDCYSYSYENGWPVVADTAGVVFMRMRLGDNDTWLWSSGPGGLFPKTNSEIKAYLDANASSKPLFALNLDNGTQKFTPAVGNGGVDDVFVACGVGAGKTYSSIGPMPVIKTIGSDQFAYLPWRNGDVTVTSWDGRWDGHMGEMVLRDGAVTGYLAGDMRFINFNSGGPAVNRMIADEVTPVTMASNTLFHAHWGASESVNILDRSSAKGGTLALGITSVQNPPVVRRLIPTGTQNTTTQYVSSSTLPLFGDTRSWGGPGWWAYWNMWDPPTPNNTSGYSDGMRPRYTFVANGYIFAVGNGGDIFVLKHN